MWMCVEGNKCSWICSSLALFPLSRLWFLLFSSRTAFSAFLKPSLLPLVHVPNNINSDLHSNSNFIPGIRKSNFNINRPLKMPTSFFPQITSHNPNQLNPSADCSLSAGTNRNVWNQYEHSWPTCRIVGATANSTKLTGCRGLISISHYWTPFT